MVPPVEPGRSGRPPWLSSLFPETLPTRILPLSGRPVVLLQQDGCRRHHRRRREAPPHRLGLELRAGRNDENKTGFNQSFLPPAGIGVGGGIGLGVERTGQFEKFDRDHMK